MSNESLQDIRHGLGIIPDYKQDMRVLGRMIATEKTLHEMDEAVLQQISVAQSFGSRLLCERCF